MQGYREGPGHPLRCNFEGSLRDLLVYFRPKQVKRIYYQRLVIPINELENKRQFKCSWMAAPPRGEEKELVLYPNKNATVADLFEEAKVSGQLELEDGGSGNLRLVEIISHKIFGLTRPEQTLESLQVQVELEFLKNVLETLDGTKTRCRIFHYNFNLHNCVLLCVELLHSLF